MNKKQRKWLIVLCCVLTVLAAGVAAYAIWEKPPETDGEGLRFPTSAVASTPVLHTASPDVSPASSSPLPKRVSGGTGRRKDCYTFLVTAMDQVGANTDTILVGRFDTAEGKLDIVNIPRDTIMNVPGSMKRINAVVALEGGGTDVTKLEDRLADILGFNIDCYALVNIRVLEQLVDCIGGVYYDVPRNMYYDDPTQDLHIHISKGYQWLNGENAVKVLRYRQGNGGTGYSDGDLGRIATQQDFLKSVASQMISVGNIPHLAEAIDIFTGNVDTDLTSGNLAFFAREFLLMDKDNITFSTAPGEGLSVYGAAYYQLDVDAWVELVNEKLNPYYESVTVENLDILRYESGVGYVSTAGVVQ